MPTKVPDATFEDLGPAEEAKTESFLESEPELPPMPKRRAGKMKGELEAMYAAVGAGIYPFNPRVGAIVVNQSTACAESLDELAKANPRVRKALDRMLTTTAWSAVLAAHLPIAVALATEYVPYIRENYMGTTSPEQDNVTPMQEYMNR